MYSFTATLKTLSKGLHYFWLLELSDSMQISGLPCRKGYQQKKNCLKSIFIEYFKDLVEMEQYYTT